MINQICGVDDPVTGDEHKHECPKCKTCFKHSADAAQESDKAFDEAHTCPVCGETEVTKKVMNEDDMLDALLRLFDRLRL